MGVLMDFSTFTPEQWRDYLYLRLTERWQNGVLSPSGRHTGRPWLEISDYYEGHHPLQFATPKFAEAYGDLFAAFADNWCEIIVDAPVERLAVQGFRFGETSDADKDAWSMWQRNKLDAASWQVHQVAIELGESYWLVDPSPDGDAPRITAEHPSQTIVITDPGDHMTRLAAFKTWIEADGKPMCTLWLPDMIYRWESGFANTVSSLLLPYSARGGAGEWLERKDAAPTEQNTLGLVPVIPVRNRPGMLQGGRSDLAPVIGLQDAINKLGSDTLVGSEFTAWPQRVLTGVQQPKDPETGQPVPKAELEAGVSRLMLFENPQARVQEWAQADPSRVIKLIEMYTQHMAAQSRTPPHYLLGQVVNASSDALVAAEAGLVNRTEAKMPHFGESHEEMMRVSFLAMGDKERAERHDAETIWGNPAVRSEAEKYDAAIKSLALGLPRKVVWETILGMSPTEIARAEAEVAVEALIAPVTSVEGAQQAAQQATGQPAAVAVAGGPLKRGESLPGTLAEADPMVQVRPLTLRV